MPLPKFTEFQAAEVQRVTRDFIRERALHLSPLTGDGNQINFIRMCNAFAVKLGDVLPANLTDQEIIDLFLSLDQPMQRHPAGLDNVLPALKPLEQTACSELLGCYLGIRRMARGG